jgi:hypothetical protein
LPCGEESKKGKKLGHTRREVCLDIPSLIFRAVFCKTALKVCFQDEIQSYKT